MNKALGELKKALCPSTAVTCSLSCGTWDRTGNAKNYFDVTWAIVARCWGGDKDGGGDEGDGDEGGDKDEGGNVGDGGRVKGEKL